MISFFVAGHPQTQGSMKAYAGRGAAAGKVFVSHTQKPKLEDWRHAIRAAVPAGAEVYAGPVTVTASFGLAKPAYKPKRKRTWPTGARSGDIDKLLRAVLDALTGVLWVDDSQVVDSVVHKDWSEKPGVTITVSDVAEDEHALAIERHRVDIERRLVRWIYGDPEAEAPRAGDRAPAEMIAALEDVRTRLIVRFRFGLWDGSTGPMHSLDETAAFVGLTRERVRQIESRAAALMRHPAVRTAPAGTPITAPVPSAGAGATATLPSVTAPVAS